MKHLRNFWRDRDGQDLVEYALLLAFVMLSAAGLWISVGTASAGGWSSAN